MRKSTILSLFSFLLLACNDTEDNTIVFDSVNADKEVKLSNEDEGAPSCVVHVQLQYATEANGRKAEVINNTIEERMLNMKDIAMQHAVDSFAGTYTRAYLKNFLPLYNQDRGDKSKRSWYDYHYVITSKTLPGYQGNTTVYMANIDYYEGGAHGINQEITLNFDNKTGHLYNLSDIFVDGYEQALNRILQEALCDKVGANNLSELHQNGYLFSMQMFPATNFILNDETITFIYNPYEIASYDKGTTELIIALDALKKILKPEFIS